ncbi:MAG: hypothetical protein ABIM89_19300, partial [Mycobacteriales bacterium]
ADAWRELGDVDGEVISLLYAGNLHSFRHNGGPAALELAERAARVGAAAPRDEGLQWILRLHRAQALSLLGRHADADALLRPLLESAPAGSWRLFLAATVTADDALVSGRPGDALPLYGVAAQLVARFGSPLGQLMQADTAAVALARLDRLQDAATTLAICELAHAELSWPATGSAADGLAETRQLVGDQRLAAGRERAAALGVRAGLAWVGALARGEIG